MALGVYRGSGTWGVSTLKVNPLTNEPMVVLFESEGDAVFYARQRAYRSGEPDRSGEKPDRSVRGRVYYILRYLPHPHDASGLPLGELKYRVLRGMRGERRSGPGAVPEHTEQILVFETRGTLPNGRPHWVLVPGLTLDVPDFEAELDAARRARGVQRISREDAIPRGFQQKTRQGRPPKFGPSATKPTTDRVLKKRQRGARHVAVEYRKDLARREHDLNTRTQEQNALLVGRLHEQIDALRALRARIDLYEPKTPKNEHRLQLIDERIDELLTQIEVAEDNHVGG